MILAVFELCTGVWITLLLQKERGGDTLSLKRESRGGDGGVRSRA